MSGRPTDRKSAGRPSQRSASGTEAATNPDALLSLQRGLTGDRQLAGTRYMDDPRLRQTYSAYYHEVSLAQVRRVARSAALHPRSVMDLGCGTGAASLAFLERGARRFILVDHARGALEVAVAELKKAARASGVEIYVTAVQAGIDDISSALSALPDQHADIPVPDLVVFSHSLNETGHSSINPETGRKQDCADTVTGSRLAIIRAVRPFVARDAVLAIIEPATLEAGRQALCLRDALLDSGCTMIGPCTHAGACPALTAGPSHSCHDECGWDVPEHVARLARSAGLDRQFIKMTWFVFGLTGFMTAGAQPQDGALPAAGLPAIPETSPAWRVVSEPMLNKGGRIRYLICGTPGRIPLSAPAGDGYARAQGFFELRRYDGLDVSGAGQRQGGLGIIPGTTLVRTPLPLP